MSKRTIFFKAAAKSLEAAVCFMDIQLDKIPALGNALVKIDPFSFRASEITSMNQSVSRYAAYLLELEKQNPQAHFLNTPSEIVHVLDKLCCKNTLIQNKIPVTPMLAANLQSPDQLREVMLKKHISQVFIKPVFCSGAAGVLAYRFHPKQNRQVLYTSCKLTKDGLYNTKKLSRLEDRGEIESLIRSILPLGTIIETWIPKAEHNHLKYDLRVLYQFRKIEYIIARQSGGPITNLHLNNQALAFMELGLSEQTLADIILLCKRTAEAFPGLHYAGIDILLEKHSLRPLVIEVNGQGDLIYQDIYKENIIFKNQVQYWLNKEKIH